MARFDAADEAALLANPGIVRNRLKIASTLTNARAFLAIQAEFGSFDAWLWRFVDGQPVDNTWAELGQVPASTCSPTRSARRSGSAASASSAAPSAMPSCSRRGWSTITSPAASATVKWLGYHRPPDKPAHSET